METAQMRELWEQTEGYMIYDEEYGGIIGVREDTPEEVKEAWQKMKAIYDEAEARGEKL